MIALIDYISFIFDYIVDILSVKPFPDFNISIIQLILTCFVLKYIFQLFFGGMKEFDISTNWMNSAIVNLEINNHNRKRSLIQKEEEKKANMPEWIYKKPKAKKASKRQIAKLKAELAEFD